jgi:hypothetical protein
MNRSDAIDKIRKMLNRNGRTEAEADTASILAAAIADKHGIDIASLDQAEADRAQEITHKEIGAWFKTPSEALYAAAICKGFFEINALTLCSYAERQIFIGTPLHIEIAEYIFGFLLKEFRWQWNRRRGKSRNRKAFIFGCYLALRAKLENRFKQPEQSGQMEFSLTVSLRARRDAYMDEKFGETTSSPLGPKERGGAAMNNGWRAGQDIEIRPGVNGGNQKQPQALPGLSGRLLTN